ncbi:MAG: TetR/AcrR family transcriptional regulator [Thermoleophilaceae bacterium]
MAAATVEPLFVRSLGTTQRARMLDAMVRVVARSGYVDVTVADVVAAAGVSRRTFYEQFDDKLDCFLAAYETGSESILARIESHLRRLRDGDWHHRLRAGLSVYTETLAADPEFARLLLIDVLGAGPRALELRERVLWRFVDHYRGLGVDDDQILRGLVGGVAELVEARILAGGAADLPDLTDTLVRFASAVLEGAADRRKP